MRPPAIRDPESFRTFAAAVEKLCEPGVLSPEQLERLDETRAVSVGERRVRGMHLPRERVAIAHEGAGVGVWLHELAHATLAAGGDAEGEARACELAARVGGFGPGTDASVLTVNGPPDFFRFSRDGGRVHVLHEKCGAQIETWHPVMPGREAHLLALCACGVSALVPLAAECCGDSGPMVWTLDASPAEPRVERTCPACGESEALMLAKREVPEPAEPEAIYRARCRAALEQCAQRLRRIARGELDRHLLDGGSLGHVRLAARRLDDDGRQHIEACIENVRELIARGELVAAAEILEGAAQGLA